MKKVKIFYWIITILICLMMGVGSVFNVIGAPEGDALMHTLNLPPALLPFLGVAKLLAIIAILVPGFPRLKEWAYAGLVYDLAGAMYTHIIAGRPAAEWAPLFLPIALLFTSYFLYHRKKKLEAGLQK